MLGLAARDATVTVNSQATYRRGEYFHKEISVSNGSGPVWQSLSIQAVDGASSNSDSGNQFVPKTPELYDHDADGNLLYDGRWDYTWDAENRLIRMIARTLTGPQQRIDFEYDASGRRIRKKVWNNTTGSGTPASDVKFLYDGWNLIAELNGLSANAVLRSYVWGNDLSGSAQGAGGVGGLLAVKSSGVCHFAAYDGNGNVLGLVSGSNGTISARYEYGPFGEMIRITGTLAQSNPFRFSTKYQDDQTGFLYYGYRYYDPSTGRWLNRDPINEPGFKLLTHRQALFDFDEEKTLYAFCHNNPLTNIDPDGREIISVAITAWSVGKGISHLVCGAYYCTEAMKCRNRAQELLDKATPGLQSTDAETALKWAEWLRSAKPGAECAELWAACGKEAALTAQWVVGGYIVKYGIRYARGYGKPE